MYAPVISQTKGYLAELPFDSARQLVMTMLKFSRPMKVAARKAISAVLRTEKGYRSTACSTRPL